MSIGDAPVSGVFSIASIDAPPHNSAITTSAPAFDGDSVSSPHIPRATSSHSFGVTNAPINRQHSPITGTTSLALCRAESFCEFAFAFAFVWW